ncbi:MAG: hypothetical protein ACRD0P_07365 [Stackebrandtia sp.]
MTITKSDLSAKGREVQQKAVDKWMDEEAGLMAGNSELQSAVEDAFSYIEPMFEYMGRREPERLVSMGEYLADTRTTLTNPVIEEIDTIKGQLDDWDGQAAENFIFDYLTPLPQTNANQVYYIGVLENTLKGVKAMLEEARKNTNDLGDSTIDALDALEDGSGVPLGLTIVAAVVGVVGAAVTGGASVVAAVSFATVAGAAGIGASAVVYEKQQVEGDDVEAVLSSMIDAYNKIIETRDTVEQDLADLLGQDVTTVQSQADRYRPKIPEIVGYGNSPQDDSRTRGRFEPPA